MGSLWTKLVYNWWSPAQPVTTGIALARSLRSPGYPGSDTMRCVSCRLCDTPASRRLGSLRRSPFFTDRRFWFPSFTFGHLSTIWLLARSHYWANGEGHVRGSHTPIRFAIGKQRDTLCQHSSIWMDWIVVPAPPRWSGTTRIVRGGKQTLSVARRCQPRGVCTVISSPPQVLRKVGNLLA